MKRIVLILISILLYQQSILADESTGTLWQVLSNQVEPLNLTIGESVTVTNTDELKDAINQANASGGNMTILIADGTYQIASPSWYPYITASNLVFRSLSGNRDAVIISGGGMRDVSPNSESAFLIVGNNVTIADLTIREVGNHGIQVSGHKLLVHNVRIQNTYQQMIKGASTAESIDSGVVRYSLLEYPSGIGPQYYIGGLDIHKGNGWVVSDNVIRNVKSPSGSAAEHGVHFWNNCKHNIVERNLIVNCDRGIGFGLGSSPNTGGIIINNMIFNDGSGQYDDVGIGLESSAGTKVYNNTVYIDYFNAIEYHFESTSDVEILNNLTNKQISSRDGGTGFVETNYTSAQLGWFVSPETGDLRLTEMISELIDCGTNLSEFVVDDIEKTPRPQGSGFDIGAYEYPEQTSIQESEEVGNPVVFPNPARGKFNVISEKRISSIHILNTLGIAVYSSEPDTCSLSFDLVDLNGNRSAAGCYFYIIKTEDGIISSGSIIVE